MPRKSEPPETKRLRQFHELGKKVLAADKQSKPLAGGKRRRGVARRFMKTRGLQRDQVDKARQFAKMYTDHDLKELCSLQSEDGSRRITKSHVIRLLAVRSKRTRAKLAKQVVRYGWCVQRLGQEVTKSGKSSRGGRRPKRPATVDEALGQIERMAQRWTNWVQMMEDSDGDQEVGITDLPGPVTRAVSRLTRSAEKVNGLLSEGT